MVRVYSSRKAWRPAAVSGSYLPRRRFTSSTQVSESNPRTAAASVRLTANTPGHRDRRIYISPFMVWHYLGLLLSKPVT
jgi:hypothetical protein